MLERYEPNFDENLRNVGVQIMAGDMIIGSKEALMRNQVNYLRRR